MSALTVAAAAALGKLTDKVFEYLVTAAIEESGAGEQVRQELRKRLGKRSPEQLAFQLALERALKRLSEVHPGWVQSLFDEALLTGDETAQELEKLLWRRGKPDAGVLAEAWARQLGTERADLQEEAKQVAATFLGYLDEALNAPDVRPALASLRDSRDLAEILRKLDELDAKLPSPDARTSALHRKYLEGLLYEPWTKVSMSLFIDRRQVDGVQRRTVSGKPVKLSASTRRCRWIFG